MFPANTYRIWFAVADDTAALSRLERQSAQPPLIGRVLIGELDGTPAAAISLDDGRVIADRSRDTSRLVTTLRMRVRTILAHEASPALRERIRSALSAYRGGESITLPTRHKHDEDERLAA
jgi:hypothetical protein